MIGTLGAISFGTWAWVEGALQSEIRSVNNISTAIAAILQNTKIYDSLISSIPDELKSSIRGLSLTLISLFLLIDFFKKSTDLKWVTWENVLMFFIKFIFAKVCIENTELIMSTIYNAFNSLTNFVIASMDIIPYSNSDRKSAYMFFLTEADAMSVINQDHLEWYDFKQVGLWLMITLQGFIMKAILTVALIIVLARFMELTIYTIAAPIPFSTLGCDGIQDIGKSYLKSYAACCIHAMVILLIFSAYTALNTALNAHAYNQMATLGNTGFMGLIKTFILGATIMKSEQWAKRICGAI